MEEKRNETGKSRGLRIFIIFIFAAFTAFAMVFSLIFGSADISFASIMHTLMGHVETTDDMVIWNIRFPRNIVGALVGANLAVSGAILQAVMKNPLADPGIVGVSSGAGLAGVMMLIFMPVFIGYITITFPAGLGIYWVVSNLVQIAQQWFMYRNTTTA